MNDLVRYARRTAANQWPTFIFWLCFGLFVAIPIAWLASVALQDQDAVVRFGQHGYTLLPSRDNITLQNIVGFFSTHIFYSSAWFSFRLFAPTSIIIVLVALGTIFRHRYKSHVVTGGSSFFFFVLSLFFNPPFATYYAAQSLELTSLAPTLTLCLLQGASAYAFAVMLLVSITPRADRQKYQEFLLNYRDPWLAYWHSIVCPIVPTLAAIILIVFSLMWNEASLSNFLTTNQTEKPFAVILQRATEQYKTEFGIFSAGALFTIFISSLILLPILIANLISSNRSKRYASRLKGEE